MSEQPDLTYCYVNLTSHNLNKLNMVEVHKVNGYRYIDNGMFLDGRNKALRAHGLKIYEKLLIKRQYKKTVKKNNIKLERLKEAAKGTKSITAWIQPR